MSQDFTPILLGSDINVYGMARSFNEAYGISVKALADTQLAPTRYSTIVSVVTAMPNFFPSTKTNYLMSLLYLTLNMIC